MACCPRGARAPLLQFYSCRSSSSLGTASQTNLEFFFCRLFRLRFLVSSSEVLSPTGSPNTGRSRRRTRGRGTRSRVYREGDRERRSASQHKHARRSIDSGRRQARIRAGARDVGSAIASAARAAVPEARRAANGAAGEEAVVEGEMRRVVARDSTPRRARARFR